MNQNSSIEICKILNLSQQRLRGWVTDTLNFFKPSIKQSGGSGQKAIYSYSDLLSYATFQYLIEVLAMDRNLAIKIVNQIRKHLKRSFNDYFIVSLESVPNDKKSRRVLVSKVDPLNQSEFLMTFFNDSNEPLTGSWEANIIINLHQIKTYIDRRIKEIG